MRARVAVLLVFFVICELAGVASRYGSEPTPRCVEFVGGQSSSAQHLGGVFMQLLLPDFREFMLRVSYDMREYKARTGRYANEWFLLGTSFMGRMRGNREVAPPSLVAKPSDGARWRPWRSMETYVIKRASETDFLVQAIEPDGAVLAELDASMERECQLKDRNCSSEYEDLFLHDHGLPTEREVLEPYSGERRVSKFLAIAQSKMNGYHHAHDDYPPSWEELGMHWAEVKHTMHDPRALPPPGKGASWRPLGSAVTYTLRRISNHQFKIEALDDRGQVKNFCDAKMLASYVPGASVKIDAPRKKAPR
jgi:hypothetical protein